MFNRLICFIKGHDWVNDTHFPVRSYHNIPYPDSYCERCELTGKEWLATKHWIR